MEKYNKIRKLGKGNFGDVHLVQKVGEDDVSSFLLMNLKFQIFYAMKKIPLEEDENSKSSLNEVKVISKLNHRNIIKYFDSFVSKNKMFIIMEYADCGCIL